MVALIHQRRCAENCWKPLWTPSDTLKHVANFGFFLFYSKHLSLFLFFFSFFQQKSFFYKLCYAIATTKVSVMKYQAVWLIAVSIADKWSNHYPSQPLPLDFSSKQRRWDKTIFAIALIIEFVPLTGFPAWEAARKNNHHK